MRWHHQQTVLIVEAGPRLRTLMAALLRKTLPTSVRVFATADGFEAMVIARQEHPDLVILGARPSQLSSSSICRLLRRNPTTAHARVLVLLDGRLSDLPIDADAYLRQPFSPSQLMHQVHELLGLMPPP